MEDRHVEVAAGRLAQLRLPRVEGEVAERAGCDHRVGPRLGRLLDRLEELAQGGRLTGLDDREAAALDLRRVVDRLTAAGIDDRLERMRLVGVLEAQELRGPQDLAAVERRDLEPLEALVRDLLQPLVARALGDQPEEVLALDVSVVSWNAHGMEVLVDALAQLLTVLPLPIRVPKVGRANVA